MHPTRFDASLERQTHTRDQQRWNFGARHGRSVGRGPLGMIDSVSACATPQCSSRKPRGEVDGRGVEVPSAPLRFATDDAPTPRSKDKRRRHCRRREPCYQGLNSTSLPPRRQP